MDFDDLAILIMLAVVLPIEGPVVGAAEDALEKDDIVGTGRVYNCIDFLALTSSHFAGQRHILQSILDYLGIVLLSEGFLGHDRRCLAVWRCTACWAPVTHLPAGARATLFLAGGDHEELLRDGLGLLPLQLLLGLVLRQMGGLWGQKVLAAIVLLLPLLSQHPGQLALTCGQVDVLDYIIRLGLGLLLMIVTSSS